MSSDWRQELDAAVDDAAERMIALRRHLHAHPEPSGEELQTSLHLYQLFDELGLAVRMGPEGCGVVVESRRQDGPRRIAVRADIDALRIQDQKQVAVSQHGARGDARLRPRRAHGDRVRRARGARSAWSATGGCPGR